MDYVVSVSDHEDDFRTYVVVGAADEQDAMDVALAEAQAILSVVAEPLPTPWEELDDEARETMLLVDVDNMIDLRAEKS